MMYDQKNKFTMCKIIAFAKKHGHIVNHNIVNMKEI